MPGFAVIYRWTLDPARVADFVSAWRAATLLIREQHGGLGSRLHRVGSNELGETWVAYAQWPSRAAWEAFQETGTGSSELIERMQAAVLERGAAECLEVVEDLLH